MRISDLEFYLVEILQAEQMPPVRSLLVRLSSDEGLEGWGEGAQAWRPSELLPRREFLLPILAGRSIFDIEELHAIDALASPALRSAVEMACWDIVGKAAGQPLCRLWGGTYRQRVPIAWRLAGRWAARIAWMARELSGHGFLAQVIMATGEPALDRQIVAAVREAVGEGVELRFDACAGFNIEAARDFCRDIEGQRLQCVIDPLAPGDAHPLAALARQANVPLAIWRGVRSSSDLLAAVRCEAAAHVVIDPEQLGGIAPARACLQIGAAAGIGLMLGSRPSLGLATAAMLHLAAATPRLTAANESAYHRLSDDVLLEPLLVAEGMMSVPEGTGLGVEVDRGKIERYAIT